MGFVPCANTAQVSMGFSQHDGTFAEQTAYVLKSAGWDDTGLTDLCDSWAVFFNAGHGGSGLKPLTNEGTSLVSITARDLTEEAGPVVVYTSGLPIAGTSAGTKIPLGITWALTRRTGLAGRSYRGRTYPVGMDESAFADDSLNQISADWAAAYVNEWNEYLAAVDTDGTTEHVVASRYSGYELDGRTPKPRVAGVMTKITAYGYHNLISDFQRRRAPAHNRHH